MARELPQDLDAERSLLGAMLISKEISRSYVSKANADDFYVDAHRLLFLAMSDLVSKNIPIDVTTMTSYLKDHGQLDKIGGVEYLAALGESVPTLRHSDF